MFNNLLSTLIDWTQYPDNPAKALGKEISAMADLFVRVAMYATLALAALVVLFGVLVFVRNREKFSAYCKKVGLLSIGYFVGLAVAMLFISFYKMYVKDYFVADVFVPTAVLLGVAIVGIIAVFVCLTGNWKKALKVVAPVCGVLLVGALIYAFVALNNYFNAKIKDDGYYEGYEGNGITSFVGGWQMWVCSAVLVAAICVLAYFTDRKNKFVFDTRSIAFASVCIAMSFALSYIKIWEMPQGGSVTLASLLPLMLYSYMYGPKKGIFAGFIYGILQAVQDPWILHPAQFLLDYPVAFAAIGLAGIFANLKAFAKMPQVSFGLGAIVAGAFRYLSHFLSGVFAFSAYAIDAGATNLYVYSLAYNSFVFVDLALVIVVGVLALSSKALVAALNKRSAAPVVEPLTENEEE